MAAKSPTNPSETLAAWNLEVAELFAASDDERQLARALLHAVRSLVPAELGYVTLHDPQLPQQLYLYPESYRHPAGYSEELWVLDPFYSAYKEGRTGVLTLRGTMPNGFEQTAYFQQFYASGGWSDELIHLIELPEGDLLTIGIARTTKLGPFTPAEIELQEAALPVVRACAARLVSLLAPARGPRTETKDIEEALHRFGENVLTPREQEVVHLVLRGHNTQSVASLLEIAPDTVKLHRKHAYAKLQVSSQGELFYKFLESLGLASDLPAPRPSRESRP